MMKHYSAITRFVRISPRKARLAAGLIKGLSPMDAKRQLEYSGLKGGRLLLKTLLSAVANAESQGDVRKENLIVNEVRIDEGPRLKRSKPRSRGSQHPFLKRMSHFTVVVAEAKE
jgi:large subunit ribosomal protein L22